MGNYLQLVLGKVIGTKNERELKRLAERVEEMNALEADAASQGLRLPQPYEAVQGADRKR